MRLYINMEKINNHIINKINVVNKIMIRDIILLIN
jgi:hypothetical protein